MSDHFAPRSHGRSQPGVAARLAPAFVAAPFVHRQASRPKKIATPVRIADSSLIP
jgi:hypothetical protein